MQRLPSVFLFAFGALLGIGVSACPPDQKASPAPTPSSATTGACTKVGQGCEFTPGKLGTCVQRDDCRDAPCFVCQSQH